MERRVSLFTIPIIILALALYAATLGTFVRPDATLAIRTGEIFDAAFGAFLMWLLGQRS